MNPVGVVFRMECGADVQVIMPEPNARIIVRDHMQGCLPKFVGSATDPLPWSVDSSKIQAVQVVQLQQGTQIDENSLPKKLPPNCSGVGSGRN